VLCPLQIAKRTRVSKNEQSSKKNLTSIFARYKLQHHTQISQGSQREKKNLPVSLGGKSDGLRLDGDDDEDGLGAILSDLEGEC